MLLCLVVAGRCNRVCSVKKRECCSRVRSHSAIVFGIETVVLLTFWTEEGQSCAKVRDGVETGHWRRENRLEAELGGFWHLHAASETHTVDISTTTRALIGY